MEYKKPQVLFILFYILSIYMNISYFLSSWNVLLYDHIGQGISHLYYTTSYCHVERTLMSFKKCSSRRVAKSGIAHWLQQVLSSLEMIFTLYFYCVCTYYKLRRIGCSQWRRNIFLQWGWDKLTLFTEKVAEFLFIDQKIKIIRQLLFFPPPPLWIGVRFHTPATKLYSL